MIISSIVLFLSRESCGAGPVVEAPRGPVAAAWVVPVVAPGAAVAVAGAGVEAAAVVAAAGAGAAVEDGLAADVSAGFAPNKLVVGAAVVVAGIEVVVEGAEA